ncbi:MAG: hypothetical protein JXR94_07725 [Candidatus Hydrogenedentes bacterium]|nr:hypothetical protein [Candidatus Hydrogenedentota bacterium]
MVLLVSWVFIGVAAVAGLVAAASPAGARRMLALFATKGRVRAMGVAFMVEGALVFRIAKRTEMPPVLQAVGFGLFLLGGIQLLLPASAVIFAEWWGTRGNAAHRLAGLVLAGLSVVFFMASQAAPAIELVAGTEDGAQ